MGSEAKPSQIETALEARMDNLALSKFRQFMRTPPLKPERTDLSGADNYLMANLKPPIYNIDIDSFPNNVSFKNPHIQVMALHQETQNLSNVYEKSPFVRSTNQELIVRKCRNLIVSFTTDNLALSGEKKLHIYTHKHKCFNGSSSSEDDEDEKPRCKYRKQHTNSVHTCKGKRRNPNSANHCREKVQWEKIDNEFVVDIIKRVLSTGVQELKFEEYYLFLHHTVSVIMKKAGVPERTVLAIMLDDFNDRFERKTKRGHVTCTIDTSQEEEIMIGFEEVECLQLYVDHASQTSVRKLKKRTGTTLNAEYVFIGYN
ncbi:uncharacterized protein LOC132754437, partial [Ruditapes philippinarum]|uniref:uncharacterized protein LOC132754437 n=1 Tax=Ruditapes philippinarum TaxID=129788 RepID=UPI00295B0051